MNVLVPQPGQSEASPALTEVSTPVGPITVSVSDQAIVRVEWSDGRSETAAPTYRRPVGASTVAAPNQLPTEAVDQLHRYFDGSLTTFDLPIGFGGTSDVARRVLTTLADTVERGTTITYGDLAERSGTGIPARAVGGIMGLNPIPIIIPCHRVVASDGLGGYSGGLPGKGLETKRWLLEFEDALPRPLF